MEELKLEKIQQVTITLTDLENVLKHSKETLGKLKTNSLFTEEFKKHKIQELEQKIKQTTLLRDQEKQLLERIKSGEMDSIFLHEYTTTKEQKKQEFDNNKIQRGLELQRKHEENQKEKERKKKEYDERKQRELKSKNRKPVRHQRLISSVKINKDEKKEEKFIPIKRNK